MPVGMVFIRPLSITDGTWKAMNQEIFHPIFFSSYYRVIYRSASNLKTLEISPNHLKISSNRPISRYLQINRPFPPTFAICRNCQKLRYSVGFVGVLSVNAGERRSPSERSNPAFRVCIN